MGLFKSKLQREYEEWVKFSRGRIALPDNEYDRFALFMKQREAYNNSNSGYAHADSSKNANNYSSNNGYSNSGNSSGSKGRRYTVKEYWQANDLKQDLINKIDREAMNYFVESYDLGEFYSLQTNVTVSEQEPLFGSPFFLINVKITGKYNLSWSSSLGNYGGDKADALSALQQVAEEVRAINRQRDTLLRYANRAAADFVNEELSGIGFADSRSIKISVGVDFDLKELEEVTRVSEYTIKHY